MRTLLHTHSIQNNERICENERNIVREELIKESFKRIFLTGAQNAPLPKFQTAAARPDAPRECLLPRLNQIQIQHLKIRMKEPSLPIRIPKASQLKWLPPGAQIRTKDTLINQCLLPLSVNWNRNSNSNAHGLQILFSGALRKTDQRMARAPHEFPNSKKRKSKKLRMAWVTQRRWPHRGANQTNEIDTTISN